MVELLLDRILEDPLRYSTLHLIYLLLDMILATHDDDPHTRNAAKRKLSQMQTDRRDTTRVYTSSRRRKQHAAAAGSS